MRCPTCGGESASSFACSICGASLSAAEATILPSGQATIIPTPAPAPAGASQPTMLPGDGVTLVPGGATGLPAPPAAGADTVLPGGAATVLPGGNETVLPSGAAAAGTIGSVAVATPGATSPPAGATGALSVLVPGQEFGRYHIIRQLGAGGMGAVYQAWDGELAVSVALKVIRPDTALDAAAREDMEKRFKREIVLARQVTHTNVLRIHDLGEIGGLKYISMPYVEGDDLDKILGKAGRLSVARTLGYARQIASGLVAAHAAGVVHRDLKPANAIVDKDDHLYLLDFGIARSLSGPRATMVAGAIGTIDYMAPEQAKGKAVDQRADIYAFGLILYDLVLGRRRMESADSAIAELMHRMEHAPVPMRLIDPAIPEAFEQIVARCVEPDADKRYGQISEVLAALNGLDASGQPLPDAPPTLSVPPITTAGAPVVVPVGAKGRPAWLLPAAAVALIAVGGGGWFIVRQTSKPAVVATANREPVSVLVADFENKTGDAVFDGIVEQGLGLGIEGASFITAYNRGAALKSAVAATKVGARLTEENARLVALREGVKVVLAGVVEPDGTAYKITARAIAPGVTGPPMAEKSVKADNKGAVLDAVGRLSADLRRALGDTTVPENGAKLETYTAANLEAAHAYAQAQDLQYAGKREDAIVKYEEALKLDPEFGRAYSGLATQHANLGHSAEAEKNYQAALARIDRMTDREKYRTRGSYYLFAREADKARQEYEALIQAFPSDTGGLANLALARFYHRDMAGAIEMNDRAVAVYPKNVQFVNNGALYAMYAGQFDKAVGAADSVLKLLSTYTGAYVAKALSQLAQGKAAEAEQSWKTLATFSTGAPVAPLGRADLALFEGRTKDAIGILTAAVEIDMQAKNANGAALKRLALADARAAAGDMPGALKEADQALALTQTDVTQFSAGRLFAQAGRIPQATKLADGLVAKLGADAQAYGKLLKAEIALAQKNPRAAIDAAKEAAKLADTWPGRLILARAYIDAGAFTEASSELDIVQKRRGEATAMFLDDVPTWRAYAPVVYWIARAQEGMKSPGAKDSYKAFLALKEKGDEQGLVADAKKRLQ